MTPRMGKKKLYEMALNELGEIVQVKPTEQILERRNALLDAIELYDNRRGKSLGDKFCLLRYDSDIPYIYWFRKLPIAGTNTHTWKRIQTITSLHDPRAQAGWMDDGQKLGSASHG